MSWLIFLFIGIAIGWLVEFLIDLFYWRSRRICPDPPQSSIVQRDSAAIETVTRLIRLESERDRLSMEQATMQSQVATLREQLHAREVTLAEYRSRESQMNAIVLGRFMSGFAVGGQSPVRVDVDNVQPGAGNIDIDMRQTNEGDRHPGRQGDGDGRVPCIDRPSAPCSGQKLGRPSESDAVRNKPEQRSTLSAASRQLLLLWGMHAATIRNLDQMQISDLDSLRNSTLTPALTDLFEGLRSYYPGADIETIHHSLVAQAGFVQSSNWERLSTESASYRVQFNSLGDDLSVIWGINAEIAQILKGVYGVRTYKDLLGLGQAGVPIVREILVETGWLKASARELWSAWSTQAALAARNLLASVRRAQADWLREIDYDQRHSFLIIPGLSPTREERLRQHNINTFADLAAVSFETYQQAMPWRELAPYFPANQSERSVFNTVVSLAALLRDNDLGTFGSRQAAFRQDFEGDVLAIYTGLDENETPLNVLNIKRHEQMAARLGNPGDTGLDQEIELVAQRFQVSSALVRQAWLRQIAHFQAGDALGMAILLERLAGDGLAAAR